MLQLIKNYFYRNLFSIILIVLLLITGAIAVHYYNKAAAPAKLIADQKVMAHPATPVTGTYTDRSGNHHAQIAATGNQVAKSSMKDPSAKRDSVIKKVTQDLAIADPAQILELTMENLQLKAENLKLKKDSAHAAMLSYADQSLRFLYDPSDSTVKSLLVNLHLNQVKLNRVRLFGSPVYDFYGDDKRVTFSNFDHLTVAVPPPPFSLVGDVKLAVDLSNGHIRPSTGLNLRYHNVFLETRKYYSFTTGQSHQTVAAGYRLNIL